MEKLTLRETELYAQMAEDGTSVRRLGELQDELDGVRAEREVREAEWMAQAELLEA